MNRQERVAWRDWVCASSLTPAHKLVLLVLSTFADYPAGTNARPGIVVLVERCRLSERAVRTALERGRRLNLIEQTARANPKRGLAAVYRLLPAPVSTGTPVPVESEPDPVSTGTVVPLESEFQPAQNGFQPANDDVSTGTLVPPTKSLTPSHNTKGGAVSDARATSSALPAPTDELDAVTTTEALGPFGEQLHSNALATYSGGSPGPIRERLQREVEPPPPAFCRRHMPDGPDGKCGACGDARRRFTWWEKRYGAAWDLLHPPLLNKPQAKSLGFLLMAEDLAGGQRDENPPAPDGQPAGFIDAEVIDEAPPDERPTCVVDDCTNPAVYEFDGRCGRCVSLGRRASAPPGQHQKGRP